MWMQEVIEKSKRRLLCLLRLLLSRKIVYVNNRVLENINFMISYDKRTLFVNISGFAQDYFSGQIIIFFISFTLNRYKCGNYV